MYDALWCRRRRKVWKVNVWLVDSAVCYQNEKKKKNNFTSKRYLDLRWIFLRFFLFISTNHNFHSVFLNFGRWYDLSILPSWSIFYIKKKKNKRQKFRYCANLSCKSSAMNRFAQMLQSLSNLIQSLRLMMYCVQGCNTCNTSKMTLSVKRVRENEIIERNYVFDLTRSFWTLRILDTLSQKCLLLSEAEMFVSSISNSGIRMTSRNYFVWRNPVYIDLLCYLLQQSVSICKLGTKCCSNLLQM